MLLVITTVMSCSFVANAQEITLLKKKLLNPIYVNLTEPNFFASSATIYFKTSNDSTIKNIGFIGCTLQPVLVKNSEVDNAINKYKRLKIKDLVLKTSAILLCVPAIITLLDKNGNNTPFLFYSGGAIALSLFAKKLNFDAEKQLILTISKHNQTTHK